MLAPPGAVDVDIRQNREGRAHPSPFTITRLHALFPSCEFGPPADRRGLARLRSCSCIIAFDLIELNGNDLRRGPLQVRKAALTSTLAKAGRGIRFNEHLECDDGEIVHASSALKAWCRAQGLALPLGAVFRWLKIKNPACAAVKREAEEGWGKPLPPPRSVALSA